MVDGFPAGLEVCPEDLNFWLAERQKGYGRGGRQRIERDEADVLSGMRGGRTLGSPIMIAVWNRDYKNWESAMHPFEPSTGERAEKVTRPRPAHADLVGALKYDTDDCRNILERASARETAARVAGGALCRKLLAEFGVGLAAHVVQIGDAATDADAVASADIHRLSMASEVRCCNPEDSERMIAAIREAKRAKDTLGGVVEARVWGLPAGLGTHVQWDRKLDARLAQAMVSIQAVKGVEFGIGWRGVELPGSRYHDEIVYEPSGAAAGPYKRTSNRLGGLEGSMTTGGELVLRVAKKPIATLMKPLRTVNLATREPEDAVMERSDTCAVPALAIVIEAVVATVLAEFFVEKFGGDSVGEMRRNFQGYVDAINAR
jgi:chorismate synthase